MCYLLVMFWQFLTGLGAAFWLAGVNHNARVKAYRIRHPDATPPEIEAGLMEEAIHANLERLFESMKGRTTNTVGMPIYWFRDTLGRARYTTSPRDMRYTKFKSWCKTPPTRFVL